MHLNRDQSFSERGYAAFDYAEACKEAKKKVGNMGRITILHTGNTFMYKIKRRLLT